MFQFRGRVQGPRANAVAEFLVGLRRRLTRSWASP